MLCNFECLTTQLVVQLVSLDYAPQQLLDLCILIAESIRYQVVIALIGIPRFDYKYLGLYEQEWVLACCQTGGWQC